MSSPLGDLFQRMRQRLPESERAAYDAWLKSYLDFGGVFARSDRELAQRQLEMVRFYTLAAGPAPAGVALPKAEQMGGWMVTGQVFSLGRRRDYRPALTQVKAPALIVHGAADLQPEAASRTYIDTLPNARLAVIPGAGPFPHLTAPAPFAAAVTEFVNGIQSP
jgi:pimeloyl-ACP methyl ester carboxylesterase